MAWPVDEDSYHRKLLLLASSKATAIPSPSDLFPELLVLLPNRRICRRWDPVHFHSLHRGPNVPFNSSPDGLRMQLARCLPSDNISMLPSFHFDLDWSYIEAPTQRNQISMASTLFCAAVMESNDELSYRLLVAGLDYPI
ncbi:hypothetical protein CISG_02726 [Coccidioides immitis RMSCC 3703]|uniref:Uncharacterized protein n=2 Tax=Coccidioides immitis TaxID=5501 RepID=A0A0J8RCT7_COCIT|nr:hypothetical protein CIRG_00346 [Coccidioides immitis RMSCC 2394]KMU81708.1 hypothetical protein CISG_02726 [Coccidioides immitis RMSCC 3703]